MANFTTTKLLLFYFLITQFFIICFGGFTCPLHFGVAGGPGPCTFTTTVTTGFSPPGAQLPAVPAPCIPLGGGSFGAIRIQCLEDGTIALFAYSSGDVFCVGAASLTPVVPGVCTYIPFTDSNYNFDPSCCPSCRISGSKDTDGDVNCTILSIVTNGTTFDPRWPTTEPGILSLPQCIDGTGQGSLKITNCNSTFVTVGVFGQDGCGSFQSGHIVPNNFSCDGIGVQAICPFCTDPVPPPPPSPPPPPPPPPPPIVPTCDILLQPNVITCTGFAVILNGSAALGECMPYMGGTLSILIVECSTTKIVVNKYSNGNCGTLLSQYNLTNPTPSCIPVASGGFSIQCFNCPAPPPQPSCSILIKSTGSVDCSAGITLLGGTVPINQCVVGNLGFHFKIFGCNESFVSVGKFFECDNLIQTVVVPNDGVCHSFTGFVGIAVSCLNCTTTPFQLGPQPPAPPSPPPPCEFSVGFNTTCNSTTILAVIPTFPFSNCINITLPDLSEVFLRVRCIQQTGQLFFFFQDACINTITSGQTASSDTCVSVQTGPLFNLSIPLFFNFSSACCPPPPPVPVCGYRFGRNISCDEPFRPIPNIGGCFEFNASTITGLPGHAAAVCTATGGIQIRYYTDSTCSFPDVGFAHPATQIFPLDQCVHQQANPDGFTNAFFEINTACCVPPAVSCNVAVGDFFDPLCITGGIQPILNLAQCSIIPVANHGNLAIRSTCAGGGLDIIYHSDLNCLNSITAIPQHFAIGQCTPVANDQSITLEFEQACCPSPFVCQLKFDRSPDVNCSTSQHTINIVPNNCEIIAIDSETPLFAMLICIPGKGVAVNYFADFTCTQQVNETQFFESDQCIAVFGRPNVHLNFSSSCCAPFEPPVICPRAFCVRTAAFWASHFDNASLINFNITWPFGFIQAENTLCRYFHILGLSITPDPICTNTSFCPSRFNLILMIDILNQPANGDAWFILAKQSIATSLNIFCENPNSAPTAVAYIAANNLLLAHVCDFPILQDDPDYAEMISLANILAAHNNGSCNPEEIYCFPPCFDSCPYDISIDLFDSFQTIDPETFPICPRKCVSTVTFWATHNDGESDSHFNKSWPIFDHTTLFCESGLITCPPECLDEFDTTVLSIIQSDTNEGDAWLVLAKQFITVVLNLHCTIRHVITPTFLETGIPLAIELLETYMCSRPIYAGPIYGDFIALAHQFNSFNNGTCTECSPLCRDACPFDIDEDIIQHPCTGCVKPHNHFRHNYACTESARIHQCYSCPWPVYRSYLKCVERFNATLSRIQLSIPTELTKWCENIPISEEEEMDRTWLAVLQQTNLNEDPRVNVSHNFIVAILNILNCACDCPALNERAIIECGVLQRNISRLSDLFYRQPLGRCPRMAQITHEIEDISHGMFLWNQGRRSVRGCENNENQCHQESVVVDTYRLKLNEIVLAIP